MAWYPLPDRTEDPVPLAAGLNRVLRGMGAPPAPALQPLFSGWEELVGGEVAAHSRPVALREGRLVVAVDDPAWATQLRWMRHELLERVAAALGDGVITDVEIRVRAAGRRPR